jgi:hypothetical protein
MQAGYLQGTHQAQKNKYRKGHEEYIEKGEGKMTRKFIEKEI